MGMVSIMFAVCLALRWCKTNAEKGLFFLKQGHCCVWIYV